MRSGVIGNLIWIVVLINSGVVYWNAPLIVIALLWVIELVATIYLVLRAHPQQPRGSLIGLVVLFWCLLFPLGGGGLTAVGVANLPLPEALIRWLNLNRVAFVVALGCLYLLLWLILWVWRRRVLSSPVAKSDPRRLAASGCLLGLFLLLGLLTTHLSVQFDRIQAVCILGVGTFAYSRVMSWLLRFVFVVPEVYRQRRMWFSWLVPTALVLLLGFSLTPPPGKHITVISHRGTDAGNGVENTEASLLKNGQRVRTIEMDVQMTADHRFVLMHDPNLYRLAGRQVDVKNLTLKQVTAITLNEAGHHAQLTSFSEYLKTAQRRHVQLIIEIKPQGLAAKVVARQFWKQYGPQILRTGYRVHSVDSEILTDLHQLNQQVPLGLIRPFTISQLPVRGYAFYSLDYRTLNSAVIKNAHQVRRPVLAWTVDSPATVNRMRALGVDALITDRYSMVTRTLAQPYAPLSELAKNIIWQLI